jgi:hypothetical protein
MRDLIVKNAGRLEDVPRDLVMLGPRLGLGTITASRQALSEGLGAGRRLATTDAIPERFAKLLDTSADVDRRRTQHPAYLRVIDELAPDEARILRLFAQRGPQPAVDVRTKRPFGVGDRLIASGLTMIGLHAGCDDPDHVPAYLDNLNRLGLISFSSESIAEVDEYQVLEAQPEVIAALKSVKRATTRLTSIELTTFGKNFCAMCGLMNGPVSGTPAPCS